MLVFRLVKDFVKVKPLKCAGVVTDAGMKFTSQTQNHSFEINNALETLIAALAACQMTTLRGVNAKDNTMKIKKIEFKNIQSSYHVEKFVKGGKDNLIDEVNLDVEMETDGTQADLDQLHKKVRNSCPVFCMLTGAGVKINSKWTNINKP